MRGQPVRQRRAQIARGRAGVIGHQPRVAGLILARDDHGGGDAGLRVQRGLDLAQFNAVAAQFDLVVHPAKKVEAPRRVAAHQVARAIQPPLPEAGWG